MEKNKKMLLWLIPFGVIAGIVMISLHKKPNLEELANDFIRNLAAKNYQEAYDLTSKNFQNSVNITDFPQKIMDSSFSKLNGINWVKQSFQGNVGTLAGEGVLKEGGSMPVIFIYHRNMYAWKLNEIRSNK